MYYWNGKVSIVLEGLSQLPLTVGSHYAGVWSTVPVGGSYSLCKLHGANNFWYGVANHDFTCTIKKILADKKFLVCTLWLLMENKVVNSNNIEETIT